ncbi:MAG: 23S rRNA (uridine(2552)-2'-O)-methyltransferase RlmE [Pseudohongiellaceae bacterium]
MARSKTSKRWLREHFDDSYVKRRHQMGYRSRASFKLLEIQQRDKLIRPGMTVVDLGAAPGGWSQVAAQLVGKAGCVVASDILPMDDISGVRFIQGDFTEQPVFDTIVATLGENSDGGVDLVISDMAPNMSGMKDIDQPRVMYLAELTLELAKAVLKPGGQLLVKVFQGSGFDDYRGELMRCFAKVKSRKPEASKPKSRELYLLATDFKAGT